MRSSPTASQKTCSQCRAVKPLDQFNFRNSAKGMRHSYCKGCGAKFTRSHYRRNKRQYLDKNSRAYQRRREFVRQIKSRPCADCGVQYPFYVMDFDHREGETKLYELNAVDRMTMKAIKCEIEKCDVVCANCHRERTFRRRVRPNHE